jgi:fibronectin type 3 domain-containing protein
MISSGIVDAQKNLNFLDQTALNIPTNLSEFDEFLENLKCDKIVHGFTNPCVHVSKILKFAGGYDKHFLKGKQCYEDDSMLLGYYYYYGTKANWHPKVNFNTVVYHAIAGQRMVLDDFSANVNLNYNGLVLQYGAMGLKSLSELHKSAWHKNFFGAEYKRLRG